MKNRKLKFVPTLVLASWLLSASVAIAGEKEDAAILKVTPRLTFKYHVMNHVGEEHELSSLTAAERDLLTNEVGKNDPYLASLMKSISKFRSDKWRTLNNELDKIRELKPGLPVALELATEYDDSREWGRPLNARRHLKVNMKWHLTVGGEEVYPQGTPEDGSATDVIIKRDRLLHDPADPENKDKKDFALNGDLDDKEKQDLVDSIIKYRQALEKAHAETLSKEKRRKALEESQRERDAILKKQQEERTRGLEKAVDDFSSLMNDSLNNKVNSMAIGNTDVNRKPGFSSNPVNVGPVQVSDKYASSI
jgi:hypothetical protein